MATRVHTKTNNRGQRGKSGRLHVYTEDDEAGVVHIVAFICVKWKVLFCVYSVSSLSPWLCHSLHLPSATLVSLVSCHTPVSMSYTCFPPYILCHSFPRLLLDCCLFSVVLCFESLPDPACFDPACLPWTPILCLSLFGLCCVFCCNLFFSSLKSAFLLLKFRSGLFLCAWAPAPRYLWRRRDIKCAGILLNSHRTCNQRGENLEKMTRANCESCTMCSGTVGGRQLPLLFAINAAQKWPEKRC